MLILFGRNISTHLINNGADMTEIKKIAILGGTGKEGTGLGMRWAHAGYYVIIGSRQLEKAQKAALSLNEKLEIDTVIGLENSDAVKEADICILTVVQAAHESALHGLKDVLQGKILVDATVRIEFPKAEPPKPPSAGRIAQDILGEGVKVVAAFQNIPAKALGKKLGRDLGIDVLICSDDVEAAEVTAGLTEAIGMGGYYAGDLDNANVVEGLTALLVKMNKHYKGNGSIRIAGIEK